MGEHDFFLYDLLRMELTYAYIFKNNFCTLMGFLYIFFKQKNMCRDFPGGPMVKNPPSNAGT